jgi:hypothetical protein
MDASTADVDVALTTEASLERVEIVDTPLGNVRGALVVVTVHAAFLVQLQFRKTMLSIAVQSRQLVSLISCRELGRA